MLAEYLEGNRNVIGQMRAKLELAKPETSKEYKNHVQRHIVNHTINWNEDKAVAQFHATRKTIHRDLR